MIADYNNIFNRLLLVFRYLLNYLNEISISIIGKKKVLTLVKIRRRIITVNQIKEITSCCRLIIINSTSSPKRLSLANTLNLFLRTKTHITISIQSFVAI